MSAQRRFAVGTTPIVIANPNPNIGKGFPPSTTLGDGNQGDPINAGSEISDTAAYKDDPTVFKGAWWALATAANQIIIVDEI